MINYVNANEFLDQSERIPVIDVRTPKEYCQGHVPGAINLPLFSDEERVVTGTLYKNSGRETSVIRGLEFTGPKLAGFVKQMHSLISGKELLIYCWRGGMRSESMAWLFDLAGFQVSLLVGGYQAYRRAIRVFLTNPMKILILGGNTGSGKTRILKALAESGEQVVDLEGVAGHKGSVYGGLGMPGQPTTEQFENDVHYALRKFNLANHVWMEDESRSIGSVNIPGVLFDQMNQAPMIRVETEREGRIDRLVEEYSVFGAEAIKEQTGRIAEKLGGANLKVIHEALDKGDFHAVVRLVLDYYDKSYEHAISRRKGREIHSLPLTGNDTRLHAMILLGYLDSIQPCQFMSYGNSLS